MSSGGFGANPKQWETRDEGLFASSKPGHVLLI